MNFENNQEIAKPTVIRFLTEPTPESKWKIASEFSGDLLAKIANAENQERLIQIIDQL